MSQSLSVFLRQVPREHERRVDLAATLSLRFADSPPAAMGSYFGAFGYRRKTMSSVAFMADVLGLCDPRAKSSGEPKPKSAATETDRVFPERMLSVLHGLRYQLIYDMRVPGNVLRIFFGKALVEIQ